MFLVYVLLVIAHLCITQVGSVLTNSSKGYIVFMWGTAQVYSCSAKHNSLVCQLTMNHLTIARSYEEDFDPEWYRESCYSTIEDTEAGGGRMKFVLDCLHQHFQNGNIRGETLLEIGTGPTVHTVISASRHVIEMHLSDLVAGCRDILQKWKDGEQQLDIPSFRYILSKENDGTTLEDRMSIVRERVTRIFSLDLRLPEPLHGSTCKYDNIISSLSLSNGANTNTEYEEIVDKVVAMMKPNGRLLIVGTLNCSFYRVANVKFNTIALSSDATKHILKNAGLELESWKEMIMEGYTSLKTDYTDTDDLYFAVYRKL